MRAAIESLNDSPKTQFASYKLARRDALPRERSSYCGIEAKARQINGIGRLTRREASAETVETELGSQAKRASADPRMAAL